MVDADPTFLSVYKQAYNGLPKYQFVLFPADLLMKSCDALMALKLFLDSSSFALTWYWLLEKLNRSEISFNLPYLLLWFFQMPLV